MTQATDGGDDEAASRVAGQAADTPRQRGKTVHGEAANAGHRVLAPDDAEVEAYLETALKAAPHPRPLGRRPARRRRPRRRRGTVVVLDFGSQFAQLIARRVRELDVYSELLPFDTPYDELERRGARAIILSGGPNSVYDEGAPRPDPAIWAGRIPVLGICYGAQLMAHELGGDVIPFDHREYGPANVSITSDEPLFAGIEREQPVWMSHGDSISRLPEGFRSTAQTDSTPYAGLVDAEPQPVRHPVPPGGRPHAARQGHPAQLRGRHRRRLADLDGRPTSSRRPSPASATGSTRMRARPARTAWSSARCRAASIRRSRRRSSIARSATG